MNLISVGDKTKLVVKRMKKINSVETFVINEDEY